MMTLTKMKISSFVLPAPLSSLFALPVCAQINLDKPISAGTSDKLFLSTADSGVTYYITIGLVRSGESEVYDRDRSSTVATFNITTAMSDLKRVSNLLAQTENKNLKVRLYRPLSITLLPGLGLSPNDHPQLTMLNDISSEYVNFF